MTNGETQLAIIVIGKLEFGIIKIIVSIVLVCGALQ